MTHIDEPGEHECIKDRRHSNDCNKFEHQGIFGFVLSTLKLHLLKTFDVILERGTVLERLEYDISCYLGSYYAHQHTQQTEKSQIPKTQ